MHLVQITREGKGSFVRITVTSHLPQQPAPRHWPSFKLPSPPRASLPFLQIAIAFARYGKHFGFLFFLFSPLTNFALLTGSLAAHRRSELHHHRSTSLPSPLVSASILVWMYHSFWLFFLSFSSLNHYHAATWPSPPLTTVQATTTPVLPPSPYFRVVFWYGLLVFFFSLLFWLVLFCFIFFPVLAYFVC